MTLGSLFDGSGTMPLCITELGGRAVWASEIEPYPIAVTRKNFPHMKHLGSVTDIDGGKIEPVDIITFGSPCQDLSIAGKRAGLDGERSSMFLEAVRIIREMRAATAGKYPKWAVWENVPGAFSSHGGKDFERVLNELLHISQPNRFIRQHGKWPKWGDYGAVAYRTMDAQYWGVAQRRRRIYLVVDFTGQRAGEVLFERDGLSGRFTPGGKAREEAARDAGNRAEGHDRVVERGVKCLNPDDAQSGRVYDPSGVWHSLNANENGGMARDAVCIDGSETARTLTERYDSSPCTDRGANVVCTLRIRSGCEGGGKGALAQTEKSGTLGCANDQTVFCMATQQGGAEILDDRAPTITAAAGMSGNNQPVVAAFMGGQGAKAGGIAYSEEVSPTLKSVLSGGDTVPSICIQGNTVDRPAVFDARGNGDGDAVPTLTGDHENRITDYTAVAVVGTYQKVTGPLMANSHPGSYTGQDAFSDMLVTGKEPCMSFQNTGQGWWNQDSIAGTIRTPCGGDSTKANLIAAVDCRNGTENANVNGTLQAKSTGGGSLNLQNVVRLRRIVRRLTPTECCRLQFGMGYDDYAALPEIASMSPEDVEFWNRVRATHAAVNGKKPPKPMTEAQAVKWYNKLHTDSAEYKMWGNGMCRYNALYVLEGIALCH